jgi:hypothetical protein
MAELVGVSVIGPKGPMVKNQQQKKLVFQKIL